MTFRQLSLLSSYYFLAARSAIPPWPTTYALNASTIIMPCSYTNLTDPASIKSWGITDLCVLDARCTRC